MFDEIKRAEKRSKEVETIKIIYQDGNEKEIKGSIWTVIMQNSEEGRDETISKCCAVDAAGVVNAIRHLAKIEMVYEDLANSIVNGTGMDLEDLESFVSIAKNKYRMQQVKNDA